MNKKLYHQQNYILPRIQKGKEDQTKQNKRYQTKEDHAQNLWLSLYHKSYNKFNVVLIFALCDLFVRLL